MEFSVLVIVSGRERRRLPALGDDPVGRPERGRLGGCLRGAPDISSPKPAPHDVPDERPLPPKPAEHQGDASCGGIVYGKLYLQLQSR